MYLILIILSTILGYFLLMPASIYLEILAFGIIVGSLFRGLYLLNDIHKRISQITTDSNKVSENHEKDIKDQ